MVEEKKQIRFKLKVSKKNFIQVVDKYFFGNMDKQLNHVQFFAYVGNRSGYLKFYDYYDDYYKAFISICAGEVVMSIEKYDFDHETWIDRKVYYPDIEYLDLLGMLVRY